MKWLIISVYAFLLLTCKESKKADLIVLNASVYTADTSNLQVEAFAISEGLIIKTGDSKEVIQLKGSDTKVLDLKDEFVMPGLIEGHGHFLSLGKSLYKLNLINTKSWKEIVDSVKSVVARTPKGQWIEGRGWHQEKWSDAMLSTYNAYPYHDELSKVSPDNPVILTHASGHALMANKLAMDMAGINAEFPSPQGGRIVTDARKKLTGVFEENAMSIIEKLYNDYEKTVSPELVEKTKYNYAISAQAIALQYGITSFEDAGTSLEDLKLLQKWYNENKLQVRLYAMLYEDPELMLDKMTYLPLFANDRNMFKSIAIKSYIDGALGSYGAWLLDDYEDNPGMRGQNIISPERVDSFAKLAIKNNLQVCVHAIGDRANREVLNIFDQYAKNDFKFAERRWRMEHAQHIDSVDIPRFKQLGVIASMQAIHCTSDAPFVIKRLGEKRTRLGAYVWKSIINSGAHLANGTDCPVESINPFECLYSAVTRKRVDNGLVFFPEQCMTRNEALMSYTIWNAYASHDEKIKGSISVGKLADFIILDRNLLTCTDEEILNTKVNSVFISGKKIY